MKLATSALRRLDAHPLLALLPPLLLAVLCFMPWDWRFVATGFRMDEVEPWIVDLARKQSINLADPTAWPSHLGTALRYAVLPLTAVLGAWGLSRLRNRLALILGWPGFAGLLAALAWWLLPEPSGPMWQTEVAVWGGWVRTSMLRPELRLAAAGQFVVLAGILAGLFGYLRMRARLKESQDLALRARLAPHFLLNSFNTLIAQIEESPREAAATVPLRQELSFAEDLLALARDRFGARLTVVIDVPEELLERELPVLGLQVLVENALRHGIEPRKAGGRVRIEARAEGKGLWVAVEDPGNGTPGEVGSGTSLDALRQRMRKPEDLDMEGIPGGFRVSFVWRG